MTSETSKRPSESGESAGHEPVESVSALASQALRVLAARRGGRKNQMSERYLNALSVAVRATDPSERDRVVQTMLSSGIHPDEICDLYIPEIARRMGRDWCEDEMSFAEVTIGSARLQALLRDIDGNRDRIDGPPRGSVAVMVLADEHHTLGAMVLTGQLRRMGVSVRLVLGRPAAEVKDLVRDFSFDAVLLSVTSTDDLEHVLEMIESLREETKGKVPFFVGGGVLELGEDHVKAMTRADFVTNDPHAALELGGMITRLPSNA